MSIRIIRYFRPHVSVLKNLSLILFALTIFTSSLPPLIAQQTTPGLVEIFKDVGNYNVAGSGVGTRGNPDTGEWTGEGTFTLSLPDDAEIVIARLIWTGRASKLPNGDPNFDEDGVELGVDIGSGNNSFTQVMAENQFFEDWFEDVQQLHESAEVMSLVQPGTHQYTVRDHEHGTEPFGTAGKRSLNYGVGLWVVYQSPAETYGEMIVFEGFDSFFRFFDPPQGPHSDIQCVQFTPDTQDRLIDMTHFVSGVDLRFDLTIPGDLPRSNAFWYITGDATQPLPDPGPVPGLFDAAVYPDAIGYSPPDQPNYPLRSVQALEWDNFQPEGIIIPAGDSWACLQIESGDSTGLSGYAPSVIDTHRAASGMWNFFAIKMNITVPPSAVELIEFTAQRQSELGVNVRWTTAEEIDNFGYNVYRSNNPDFSQAEWLHFEPSKVSGGTGPGQSYEFVDTVPAYDSYYYWLEDVDTADLKTVHGPIGIDVSRIRLHYLPLIRN